jgi:hypothetical protein
LSLVGSFAVICPAEAAPKAAEATVKEPQAAATRPRVEEMLSKEGGRLGPKDIKAMGKDADLVLIDISRDSHASTTLRTRAVDALAASATVVGREHLVRLTTANSNEADLPLVRKALLGLGWMHDSRIVDNAGPWLEHKSTAVRLDTAVALALSKNAQAFELLERHNRNEKDAEVRQKIQRLIKQYRDEQPKAAPKAAQKPRIEPPGPMEGRR